VTSERALEKAKADAERDAYRQYQFAQEGAVAKLGKAQVLVKLMEWGGRKGKGCRCRCGQLLKIDGDKLQRGIFGPQWREW
jgi:hypothetical protein